MISPVQQSFNTIFTKKKEGGEGEEVRGSGTRREIIQ